MNNNTKHFQDIELNQQPEPEKVFDQVYLLMGSNIGDRFGNFQKAKELLIGRGIILVNESSVYETAAWGKTDQPKFLNLVLQIISPYQPEDLIQVLQQTEKEIGRIRYEKWGPRIIDIDILFFGKEIIVNEDLKIPHAALHERRFTLTPLCEIAPEFKHPVLNLPVKALLDICEDNLEVRKVNEVN